MRYSAARVTAGYLTNISTLDTSWLGLFQQIIRFCDEYRGLETTPRQAFGRKKCSNIHLGIAYDSGFPSPKKRQTKGLRAFFHNLEASATVLDLAITAAGK